MTAPYLGRPLRALDAAELDAFAADRRMRLNGFAVPATARDSIVRQLAEIDAERAMRRTFAGAAGDEASAEPLFRARVERAARALDIALAAADGGDLSPIERGAALGGALAMVLAELPGALRHDAVEAHCAGLRALLEDSTEGEE